MALSTAVKMILLAAKGWPPRGVDSVLWRAEFTTSYAAPLTSPHTATDDGGVHSVGQAILTDAESLLYTSAGALQIPAQATPAWGDMTLVAQDGAGGDFTQEIGRAVAINLAVTTGGDLFAGYSNSKTPGTSLAGYYGLRWKAAGALYLQDGVTETEIGSYTPSAEHSYIVLTRPTGLFLLQDGVLIYIHDTAYTAPFPFVSNFDAAGFMTVGNLVDLSTDIPGIYPVPQLSDTFTSVLVTPVSDGLAHPEGPLNIGASDGSGVTWVKGTWSQAAGLLSNAPVAGPELLVNPGGPFTFTGDDPDNWIVVGEVGSDPEISEVASGESHADAPTPGGGLVNLYSSGASVQMQQDVSGLAVGDFCFIEAIVDTVAAGGLTLAIIMDAIDATSGVALTTRAINTIIQFKRREGSGDDVTSTSYSVKKYTLADLITGNPDFTLRYPNMRSAVPTAVGYQTGGAMRLDSLTNPTVGFLIYCDFNDNNIRVIDNAVNSEILSFAFTPNDGATLAAWLLDDDILRVQYDGGEVHTVAVTPDENALLYGAFNTGGDDGASVGFQAWDTLQFNAPGGLL